MNKPWDWYQISLQDMLRLAIWDMLRLAIWDTVAETQYWFVLGCNLLCILLPAFLPVIRFAFGSMSQGITHFRAISLGKARILGSIFWHDPISDPSVCFFPFRSTNGIDPQNLIYLEVEHFQPLFGGWTFPNPKIQLQLWSQLSHVSKDKIFHRAFFHDPYSTRKNSKRLQGPGVIDSAAKAGQAIHLSLSSSNPVKYQCTPMRFLSPAWHDILSRLHHFHIYHSYHELNLHVLVAHFGLSAQEVLCLSRWLVLQTFTAQVLNN